MIKITRISILLAFSLFWCAGGALAGETCGCDIAPAQVQRYDAQLFAADPVAAEAVHAPYGIAVAEGPETRFTILAQLHWLTGYDSRRRMPLWVAYRLTAADVAARRSRTQCFRPDPRLSADTGATGCASYVGDGMDRGHMVASADMTRSEQAMVNTYVFSNIAHQYPGFNRTLWRGLESHVRALARLRGKVYVMTGAVFDHDDDARPDASGAAPLPDKSGQPGAAIASHFYKVVIVPGHGAEPPEIRAWLLRHENIRTTRSQSKQIIANSEVPLAVIEQLGGLDIAPLLNGIRSAEVSVD